MRFGDIETGSAGGTILAHAIKLGDGRIAKGTRLSREDLARLSAAGIDSVAAAVLEPGDLAEDEAAGRIGARAGGAEVEAGPAATGRVNFFATAAGLFLPERAIVDAINRVDPGITLATLKAFEPVETGRMVATVKIIPLALSGAAVAAALDCLAQMPAFAVAPYRAQAIGLIQTELPGTKKSVLDKTKRVLEARLARAGSSVTIEMRTSHRSADLAERLSAMTGGGAGAIPDMTVIFGASAVIDAGDVIPAAIRLAGGTVHHLGMPVDPGNLLLLGEIAGRPVIGAPGCARSPKENGFDWVLDRLLADLSVSGDDIRGMGVGGLLMEIATRPSPRLSAARNKGDAA